MLNELAHAHQLARQAELFLGCLEGRNAGLRMVRPVQVPSQKARKVLQRAEDFVATDWGVLVLRHEGKGGSRRVTK